MISSFPWVHFKSIENSRRHRPKERTGVWGSIFPNEQVTEQQSALFVKKLLAVAISNVTYLRAIFPEHAFGDRCLEDLNLKILRDDSSCPGACQVIKWVKGCFDALDKKYLRMLVIGIYTDQDDPETVIESYTFKFSYSKEGGIDIYRNNKQISSVHSAAETKKATIRLLRTILVLTQTLNTLPDDVMMTMKLMYYDEVTPSDYEPPGFKSAELDGFRFEDEPTNIKVGDVQTPFHTVKLRIKTDGKQFQMAEEPIIEEKEEKNVDASQEISNNGLDNEFIEEDKNSKVSDAILNDDKSVDKVVSKSNKSAISKESIEESLVPAIDNDAKEDFSVRCPCGCNEDDGLMIMCAVCSTWQHGLCFLVVEEDEAPEEHICDICSSEKQGCSDPLLSELTPIEVQATCLWRRALMACLEMKRVLPPSLAKRLGVEITVAHGLINRLTKEKYIRYPIKGKKLGKVVEKSLIKTEAIPKYFKQHVKPVVQDSQECVMANVSQEDMKDVSQSQESSQDDEKENNEPLEEEKSMSTTPVSDVEMLVKQTSGISLNHNKSKLKQNKEKKKTSDLSDSPIPRKGTKRAFSKVDNTNEFDLSSSQDFEGRLRKRKASVVSNAIMV